MAGRYLKWCSSNLVLVMSGCWIWLTERCQIFPSKFTVASYRVSNTIIYYPQCGEEPLKATSFCLEMEKLWDSRKPSQDSEREAGRHVRESRKGHWLGRELPITSGEHQQNTAAGSSSWHTHFCSPGPPVPTMPLPPGFNLSPGECCLISALLHRFCCSLSPRSVWIKAMPIHPGQPW